MFASRHRLVLVQGAAFAVTVAYALAAATTRPFTTAADVVTAIPIAALGAAALVRWPLHPGPDRLRAGADAGQGSGARPSWSGRALRWGPWVALLSAVVAWELVEYLASGSRGAHPTLSSMADTMDRHFELKAAVFLAWLWLGVMVVRAGSVRGR